MSLTSIRPEEARRLIDQGAILIDIREADEHAREKIVAAQNVPLSTFERSDLPAGREAVIFHCKGGARTQANAQRLAAKVDVGRGGFLLEGGLDGWRKAGFAVVADRGQPIEIQRQVQIGAGSLVLLGTLLGIFVSPGFLAIPAFVGAGLTMAGITGFCGMARLLMKAPWNRTGGVTSARTA